MSYDNYAPFNSSKPRLQKKKNSFDFFLDFFKKPKKLENKITQIKYDITPQIELNDQIIQFENKISKQVIENEPEPETGNSRGFPERPRRLPIPEVE